MDPSLTDSKDLGSDAEDNDNLYFYNLLLTNIELPTTLELFNMSSKYEHGSAFLDKEISMLYEDEEKLYQYDDEFDRDVLRLCFMSC